MKYKTLKKGGSSLLKKRKDICSDEIDCDDYANKKFYIPDKK